MPLEISFETRDLRTTCESSTRAKRALGELGSEALQRVLADMNAVETVAELLEMDFGVDISIQEQGMLRFQLHEDISLYCDANLISMPSPGEALDWAQVTRLKVVHIGSSK